MKHTLLTAVQIKLLLTTSESLIKIYEDTELAAMSLMIIEDLYNKNAQGVLLSNELLPPNKHERWQYLITELEAGKPIQYALGYTYFAGLKLLVNKEVLIPRPETDELVYIVANKIKHRPKAAIVDLCTGSGCIALGLKKALPQAHIIGVEVSEQALDVAKQNAQLCQLEVQWELADVLDEKFTLPSNIDLIVSNPPYIAANEAKAMSDHVLQYEPHIALFVQNNDPLEFYKRIATLGMQHLSNDGEVYCELNNLYAEAVQALFVSNGYAKAELLKDMYGNVRFLWAGREIAE
jgi:release factor glutamine methyltransferase